MLATLLAGCTATSGPAGTPSTAEVSSLDDHDHGAHDHAHDHHHDHAAPGGANRPFTGSEDRVFEVRAGQPDEFKFAPTSLEVWSGATVGIVFRNDGEVEHEFALNDLGFHLHAGPGETVRGAFVAPEPGTYAIGCYLPGHYEAGMRGTLAVSE